jgi:hypothetical protein
MTTDATTTGLAIWGALAPIAVSAASQWWARRGRREDRIHDLRALQEERKEKNRQETEKRSQQWKDTAFEYRRSVVLEFTAAALDFLWADGATISGSSAQDRDRHRERFSKAYAALQILDAELREPALEVWNATYDMIRANRSQVQADIQAATELLKLARARFSKVAHDELNVQLGRLDPRHS